MKDLHSGGSTYWKWQGQLSSLEDQTMSNFSPFVSMTFGHFLAQACWTFLLWICLQRMFSLHLVSSLLSRWPSQFHNQYPSTHLFVILTSPFSSRTRFAIVASGRQNHSFRISPSSQLIFSSISSSACSKERWSTPFSKGPLCQPWDLHPQPI